MSEPIVIPALITDETMKWEYPEDVHHTGKVVLLPGIYLGCHALLRETHTNRLVLVPTHILSLYDVGPWKNPDYKGPAAE